MNIASLKPGDLVLVNESWYTRTKLKWPNHEHYLEPGDSVVLILQRDWRTEHDGLNFWEVLTSDGKIVEMYMSENAYDREMLSVQT